MVDQLNAHEKLIRSLAQFVYKNGEPKGILVNVEFDTELLDSSSYLEWTGDPTKARDTFAGIPYAVVKHQSVPWRFVIGDQE